MLPSLCTISAVASLLALASQGRGEGISFALLVVLVEGLPESGDCPDTDGHFADRASSHAAIDVHLGLPQPQWSESAGSH